MTSTLTTLAGQLARSLAAYDLTSAQCEDAAGALRILADSLRDEESRQCVLDAAHDLDFFAREALDRETEAERAEHQARRRMMRRRMGEIV